MTGNSLVVCCQRNGMMSTPARRSVLIETTENDLHGLVIAHALRERGHSVLRHFGSRFPVDSSLSFAFGDAGHGHRLCANGLDYSLADFDVVWNRRPENAVLPACVVEADGEFARRELAIALSAFRAMTATAFHVNPASAGRMANIKPRQLALAECAGLRLPRTLISNDPEAIRSFLHDCPKAIYKPLSGKVWNECGSRFGTYTAPVRASDMPRDELLRATPGIFQQKIDKAYEVRAQFFGATCLAVKIDSAKLQYGEFDWRLHQNASAAVGAIEVPTSIQQACLRLLRSLDLVAGGFDFIVGPDGAWTFLEVNEAGQFLFIEQWCTELPVVDAFCAFVESRDPAFVYRQPRQPRRFEALRNEYPFDALLAAEREQRNGNRMSGETTPVTSRHQSMPA